MIRLRLKKITPIRLKQIKMLLACFLSFIMPQKYCGVQDQTAQQKEISSRKKTFHAGEPDMSSSWRAWHEQLLTAIHKPTASWYHACKLHTQHRLCLLSCGLIIHAYPLICKSSWWSYKKNYKGIIVGWMCQFHSWSALCSTWSPRRRP